MNAPAPILARPALIEIVDNDGGELTACITPLRVVRPIRFNHHGFDASPVAFEAGPKVSPDLHSPRRAAGRRGADSITAQAAASRLPTHQPRRSM